MSDAEKNSKGAISSEHHSKQNRSNGAISLRTMKFLKGESVTEFPKRSGGLHGFGNNGIFETIPEKYKDWKRMPNHPEYLVSSKGTVYNSKTKTNCQKKLGKDGYVKVRVDDTICNVHEIVMRTYSHESDHIAKYEEAHNVIMEVLHIDGDKRNNDFKNLKWKGRNRTLRVIRKDHSGRLKVYPSLKEAASDNGTSTYLIKKSDATGVPLLGYSWSIKY